MKGKYHKLKKGIALLCGLFLIATFTFILVEKNKSNNYSQNLVLEFGGIITELREVDGRTAMVTLDLSFSNLTSYDLRGKESFYCCVIKDGKAEVIMHPYFIKVGDSLTFGPKNQVQIFREEKLIKTTNENYSNMRGLYKKVRKMHRL